MMHLTAISSIRLPSGDNASDPHQSRWNWPEKGVAALWLAPRPPALSLVRPAARVMGPSELEVSTGGPLRAGGRAEGWRAGGRMDVSACKGTTRGGLGLVKRVDAREYGCVGVQGNKEEGDKNDGGGAARR